MLATIHMEMGSFRYQQKHLLKQKLNAIRMILYTNGLINSLKIMTKLSVTFSPGFALYSLSR